MHATRARGGRVRHGEALYDAGHSRIPYWGGALCFRGPLKERLLRDDHRDALRTVERIWDEGGARRGDADLFQRMTYLELRQRLPELLLARMDRIAMASSVEGREPFLDHELVELAMALPPRMKYRDGTGQVRPARGDARRAARREVLARPKQGFGSPMEEWLRGAFGRDAHAAVRGSALAERELLDYDVVDRLFAAQRRGRGDWSKHLWNLYCVSEWYDRWVTAMTSGARSGRLPAGHARGTATVGSPEFFADVEARRYALEPDIAEIVASSVGRAGTSSRQVAASAPTPSSSCAPAPGHGLDFSPRALELARRRPELADADLVAGSITDAPSSLDASFDLVYSNGVSSTTAPDVARDHRVPPRVCDPACSEHRGGPTTARPLNFLLLDHGRRRDVGRRTAATASRPRRSRA